MKIAYTTTFNMQAPSSWPKRHLGLYGAGAKIVQVLANEGTADEGTTDEKTTVEYLGTLTRKRSPITRLKWLFYRNLFEKDFYSWADPIVGRYYARQVEQKLSESDADILLCPENAIPLANVKPDRPMVLWTDATLGSLIDFYPYLSNLCGETRRNLMRMEKRVLDRCSLLIVNSEWAAQQANELYDISLSKIEVIPRGANKIHDLSADELEEIIRGRSSQVCQLLFVAVEWGRKGGDTALGVARSLNQSGIKTELHVVGCQPPTGSPDFVIGHGFIDRTTAAGQAKMDELFRTSHFLMYPTKADALGMALSEAAAFGVPALASRVGGIPGLVKSGITGETFAVDADFDAYCKFVSPYMKDMGKYEDLAMSTFRSYRNHMSWPAVGERARSIFRTLLN